MSKHVVSLRGQCRAIRHHRSRHAVSKPVAIGAALVVTGLMIVGTTVPAFAATGVMVTITVTPSTGLTNGQSVTISGSGFAHTSIGNILECNSDANQPNVMVGGVVNSSIPVSCNAPSLSKLVTTTATGSVSGTFAVIQGTVGPPCGPAPAAATCPATDSAGKSPTADAALYPCPPTAAQIAAGDTCQLTYGDEANDSGTGNITFAGTPAPPPAATTAPPTTPPTTKAPTPTPTVTPTTAPKTAVAPITGATGATTIPAPATTTPAATGTLATTGPGPSVGVVGAIGVALLLLGLFLLMVLLNGPRRVLAGLAVPARIRRLSLPIHRDPDGSMARQAVGAASRMVGHVDHVGRRIGESASRAPAAARGLTHRVASASTRTASWLLGR